MRKETFDADKLTDYDIERIADKIEDTGRIATAVKSEISDQIYMLIGHIDEYIDKNIKKAIKSKGFTPINEPYIELLKYILKELSDAN